MTRLALTAARLIDGINPAVDGATVVIEGDRIVGVSSDLPPEDVDTVIDLAGRTLMPGMFTSRTTHPASSPRLLFRNSAAEV